MKKIKSIRKWWNKKKNQPITWGQYAKYCKWTLGLSALYFVILFIVLKISDVVSRKKAMKNQETDD